MSWFDAHESYVIEMAVRDRVEELHSTLDRARSDETPPADREARRVCDEGMGMACRALAKASR